MNPPTMHTEISVVRGNPTDEELAELTVVLALLSPAAAEPTAAPMAEPVRRTTSRRPWRRTRVWAVSRADERPVLRPVRPVRPVRQETPDRTALPVRASVG